MKKLTLIALAAVIMMIPSFASAQTASGTLTVTATVNQRRDPGLRQCFRLRRSGCRRGAHHHRDHLYREFGG